MASKTNKEDLMATIKTNKKPNVKNIRSKALNATKKKQGLNLKTVKLSNGDKLKLTTRELRTLKKEA